MHSLEELKALINGHRVKTQSNRLSPALRRMVSEAFKGSRMPVAAFSKSIGVAPMSVLKWSKDIPSQPASFKKVAIIVEQSSQGMVLHGPCGIRIEGLDAQGLCQILRALGGH
ncbi:MAG: hypothetical protein M3Q07_08615 [Pseudobdellovibrionaceae bacterium]|nr:hypothetical protein [Pseudobdellovibrionaceae bacterium]